MQMPGDAYFGRLQQENQLLRIQLAKLQRKVDQLERTTDEHRDIRNNQRSEEQSRFFARLKTLLFGPVSRKNTVLYIEGFVEAFPVLGKVKDMVTTVSYAQGYATERVIREDILMLKEQVPLLVYVDTFIYGGDRMSSLGSEVDRDGWFDRAAATNVPVVHVIVTSKNDEIKNNDHVPEVQVDTEFLSGYHRLVLYSNENVYNPRSNLQRESIGRLETLIKSLLPLIPKRSFLKESFAQFARVAEEQFDAYTSLGQYQEDDEVDEE